MFCLLCQTWTGTTSKNTMPIFIFCRKSPKWCFFSDCTAPGPILFLYKNTSSIYFSGDITDMVFCLLYQTWLGTISKNTTTICNQPGSQVTQVRHGPQVISQVLNTLDGDGKKMHQWFHLKPLTWVFLLKPLYLSIVLKFFCFKTSSMSTSSLGMVSYFLTWSFYLHLKLVPKKEQIINLNALIPSQKW